ncbi:MAG: glycosyltransferase family 4 protein [Candidatus Pacebacteria bacterium]|nr:glycosyltransferase family 4 protein [Candidatus Paceibacterota bacterium]
MRKKNLRVGLFLPALLTYGGGVEKYFIELARNLTERGAEVNLITIDEASSQKIVKLWSLYYGQKVAVTQRETKAEVSRKIGLANWHSIPLRKMKSLLKKNQVIYVKNEFYDLFLLKLMGLKNLPPIVVGVHTAIKIPFVGCFHNKLHNFLYASPLYRWLLRGAGLVQVPNRDDQRLIEERFGLKAILIHHPFEAETTGISRVKSELIGTHRCLRFLFVGRFVEQKGIDILFAVIKALSTEKIFSKLHFRLAGQGDNQVYQREAVNLGKEFENVDYLGYVPNSKIGRHYSWTDIVLVPSRHETVNFVVLEAGAAGRVVIASDIPGPREIIVDRKTGFLINLSVEAFVKKIEELFRIKEQEPAALAKIGRAARKQVTANFNPQKIYQQFERMLLSVAKEAL